MCHSEIPCSILSMKRLSGEEWQAFILVNKDKKEVTFFPPLMQESGGVTAKGGNNNNNKIQLFSHILLKGYQLIKV